MSKNADLDRLTMLRRLVLLIAVSCCTRAGAAAPDAVAIRNVTIIPMVGVTSAANQTVLVRNGRIAQIGNVAQIQIPAGTTIVDGTGKFLIPGLFDMHVHTSITRASSLNLFVIYGVTTIRDQGSDPGEVLNWRRESRDGKRVGPQMLVAGPYLESRRNVDRLRQNVPRSNLTAFNRARLSIDTPEDARRVIDSLAPLGFDHFKVRTVQDAETYLALANAVHAHDKRLVGHWVATTQELFLQARQDGVEHGFPTSWDSQPTEDRLAFWCELARRDVGVVPTLVAGTESFFPPLTEFQQFFADTTGSKHPLRPYMSPVLIARWREQAAEAGPERSDAIVRTWPIRLKHTREMRDAGVRLMAGTDAGLLNVFPGASLHEELRLFVDLLGMTPLDALERATRKPAEWLGLADSVGTITAGKTADLVLLNADPVADISNTKRIVRSFCEATS
jgi:imidazolonepropionase-like amidohydrolase